MEKMPYQPSLDTAVLPAAIDRPEPSAPDWRRDLPALRGAMVTLREMRIADAPALFAALTTEQVSRFISPPPSSVEGFERFIAWSQRQRAAGQYVCFAVVPHGSDVAIGLYQIRSLEPAFGTSEWGFALAEEFWGSGVFMDGAKLAATFAFEVLGVRRLEARAAVRNGRGIGALRKLGAVQEGLLRRSLLRHGEWLDQSLWTLLADEWHGGRDLWIAASVVH
ncbi:MAG: GNAT family N-acetyltransferase [Acidobacteria bacterium]|nr:GNAT family N-acetyltransferase [Acidobacteriota bacterium]